MQHPRLALAGCVLAALASAACSTSIETVTDDARRSADSAVRTREDAPVATDARPSDDAWSMPPCGCLAGEGTYCEASLSALAAETGCVIEGAAADGDRLFACAGDTWTPGGGCTDGCVSGETGATASCELPVCDCFVRVSWCGASAARHALTLDPPCRVPLVPEHDEDVLGCDGARWVVLEACDEGCAERATGTPDGCVSRATPEDPGWATCPHRDLLHSGLHPEASDRLRCAGVSASRITQTIGSAPASAGYHASDGTADGRAYTAAVDLSTRDLSSTEIRALLQRLGENGFAAWYRQPGSDGWPASEAPHIHAVFAGVVMKSALRAQVRDFLDGRNGLTSHSIYRFWPPPADVREIVSLLFSRHYTP